MRALLAILVIGVFAAPAAADPPAPPPATKKPAAKPAAKKPAAKPAAKPPSPGAATPGVSLSSMARAATGPAGADADPRTPNGARRLDLTPARLFGVKGPATDKRGSERGSGTSLGDDSSWAVQAAQVGAMAVGFAALWALCGGGNCMLPDVLPDAFTSEEGLSSDVQIRPEPEVRSAR